MAEAFIEMSVRRYGRMWIIQETTINNAAMISNQRRECLGRQRDANGIDIGIRGG